MIPQCLVVLMTFRLVTGFEEIAHVIPYEFTHFALYTGVRDGSECQTLCLSEATDTCMSCVYYEAAEVCQLGNSVAPVLQTNLGTIYYTRKETPIAGECMVDNECATSNAICWKNLCHCQGGYFNKRNSCLPYCRGIACPPSGVDCIHRRNIGYCKCNSTLDIAPDLCHLCWTTEDNKDVGGSPRLTYSGFTVAECLKFCETKTLFECSGVIVQISGHVTTCFFIREAEYGSIVNGSNKLYRRGSATECIIPEYIPTTTTEIYTTDDTKKPTPGTTSQRSTKIITSGCSAYWTHNLLRYLPLPFPIIVMFTMYN